MAIRLYLKNGSMNIPGQIQPTDPAPFSQYMWWVDPLSGNSTRYNFYAVGNYGQFIYVIPEKNIVIVRHGYKSEYDNWTDLFKQLGSKI